jgi:acyl-coenzyme A synthetase/AMP-(fatty) acid ligase
MQAVSLRSVLGAAAGIGQARFLADDAGKVGLASLAGTSANAGVVARAHGKTVLLAIPRQLSTLAALLQLDGVAGRIVLRPGDRLPDDVESIVAAAGVDEVVTAWELPDPGVSHGQEPAAAPAVATQWVLFTSGTTKQPKMVVHTLESLAGHLWASAAPDGGPVWCTFYDIRRYGGLQVALRALIGGGSLVLSGGTAESAGLFLQRAAQEGATHFVGTPSHWRRALMSEAATEIAPRYVRLSGEVADQAILDRLRARYPQAACVHAFASTEAGLGFEVPDGVAGFPAALIENPAGAGVSIQIRHGNLHIRSPRNAAGYLNGSIAALTDSDGFVNTGDAVELQADGRYHFAGRQDGVVNVGGQKVHPEEVEAVINRHPAVDVSVVISKSNPITGAIVVAHVVRRDASAGMGTPGTLEDDIRAFCRQHLAPHKVPALIRFVPQLDLSPTGKLVRASA